METNQPEQKKKWDLITGVLMTLFGSYRLYSHYFADAHFSNFRLGLTFAITGLGLYSLHKYFIKN